MGWTGSKTAIRDFATLSCQARKCTFCRMSAAINWTPPQRPLAAMPALAIYWCSKRFFQWRRPSLSSSGARGSEFAPGHRVQQRLVAGDGAQLKAERLHRPCVGAVETEHCRIFPVRLGALDDPPHPLMTAAPLGSTLAPLVRAIETSDGPTYTPSRPSTLRMPSSASKAALVSIIAIAWVHR